MVPWGLAYNPTLNILPLVVKLNLWNSLVLVHNRPLPPAAPITDYGFAELLTIVIVCALNYAFLCVFLTSLQYLRCSEGRSALPVCDGDLW